MISKCKCWIRKVKKRADHGKSESNCNAKITEASKEAFQATLMVEKYKLVLIVFLLPRQGPCSCTHTKQWTCSGACFSSLYSCTLFLMRSHTIPKGSALAAYWCTLVILISSPSSWYDLDQFEFLVVRTQGWWSSSSTWRPYAWYDMVIPACKSIFAYVGKWKKLSLRRRNLFAFQDINEPFRIHAKPVTMWYSGLPAMTILYLLVLPVHLQTDNHI